MSNRRTYDAQAEWQEFLDSFDIKRCRPLSDGIGIGKVRKHSTGVVSGANPSVVLPRNELDSSLPATPGIASPYHKRQFVRRYLRAPQKAATSLAPFFDILAFVIGLGGMAMTVLLAARFIGSEVESQVVSAVSQWIQGAPLAAFGVLAALAGCYYAVFKLALGSTPGQFLEKLRN